MYNDNVEIRDVEVDGETNWYWIKNDTGAFTGPSHDWLSSHKAKYFKNITNYDTIVTAGTNCGMYARFYSKMFKHVYAFEPEPMAFFCMVNNCPCDNVVKMNAALGRGHGIVGIHRAAPGGDAMNVGMNVVTHSSEQFKIPMVTIDSLGLEACSIIQLDVEGYEREALIGASNTIKQFHPVIVAERFYDRDDQIFMQDTYNYQLTEISCMDAIYTYNSLNTPGEYFTIQT